MIGCSYEGFTVVMALLDPHPALKVAAPRARWSMAGWATTGSTTARSGRPTSTTSRTRRRQEARATPVVREGYDDYENFRRAGSAGDFAKAGGLDQLPWWRKIAEHPAYDAFWQGQALDKTDGRAAAEGADDVDSGTVGPGGHVGRDPQLPGGRAEGHGATTRTTW